MSRLRARCPACRTLTAVAVDLVYECHSCGRVYPAGLVRVMRAWGEGGDLVASAADAALPFPEAARVDARTLADQTLLIAASLPARTVVLGGCAAAHVGTAEGLATAVGRLAVVWVAGVPCVDARPVEPWQGALGTLLAAGTVRGEDTVLVGALAVDAHAAMALAAAGVRTGVASIAGALTGTDAVLVAIDGSAIAPGEGLSSWRSPAGRTTLAEVADIVRAAAATAPIRAIGVSGLAGPIDDPSTLAALVVDVWT